MFSQKLNIPDVSDIPKDVLQDLQEHYLYPDAWKDNNNSTSVQVFKDKMKEILSKNQNERCAYCELPLKFRNPELEHVAPKGGEKENKIL